MNAFIRLAIGASAAYLGIQIARMEPGLAFPLGILAAVFAGLWISHAIYDERAALVEISENDAIEDEFGTHMAALALEEHHDRWAE